MGSLSRDELAMHIPRLYRVAMRVLGNHHTAEEVVQEVCLRVLEKRGGIQFHANVQPSTFLHRAAVNCALDRLRREQLEDRVRQTLDGGHVSERITSPDQIAERRDLFKLAASLVSTLPDDCRLAFVLTQIDGYTYDEAAQIEDKPRGTIASRVARAKSMLLAAMTEARI